eukprot:gene8215-40_t
MKGNVIFMLYICLFLIQIISSQVVTCFGKVPSDADVCSGKGTCVSTDLCTCRSGYDGLLCEINLSKTEYNKVFSFGGNSYGELGDGTASAKFKPVEMVTQNYLVSTVASGYRTSFVVKNFSRTLGFGANSNGEIGDASEGNVLNPTGFSENTNVKSMKGGFQHTLMLKLNGSVYSSGSGVYGQLGLGSNVNSSKGFRFVQHSIVEIDAGFEHSLMLKEDSSVYSFGKNTNGELGVGDTTNRFLPTKVLTISNAIQVCAGRTHSMVLVQSGQVYTFGSNLFGQLGIDSYNDHKHSPQLISNTGIVSIASGDYHSFLITSTGKAFGFGWNNYYQVGDGSNTLRRKPRSVYGISNAAKIAAGTHHTLVLTSNGKLYGFGSNTGGQMGNGYTLYYNYRTLVADSMSGIVDVSAGRHTTLIVQSQHTCFGKNNQQSSVCSGIGVCVNTNVCRCPNGNYGNECEVLPVPTPTPIATPNPSPHPTPAFSSNQNPVLSSKPRSTPVFSSTPNPVMSTKNSPRVMKPRASINPTLSSFFEPKLSQSQEPMLSGNAPKQSNIISAASKNYISILV